MQIVENSLDNSQLLDYIANEITFHIVKSLSLLSMNFAKRQIPGPKSAELLAT